MLSRLRSTSPKISLARIFLATMLALALLSGLAPLTSLSSARACRMACCAGKPAHLAGSCSVEFADEDENESADEQGEEQTAHSDSHHMSGAASEEIASSGHDEALPHPASHSSSDKKSSGPLQVASQAMTTPCSPECAAATPVSTQLRRPRDAAAMSVAGKPRPPTLIRLNKELSSPLLQSAERRRQLQPRAPPSLLINLSA